MWQYPLKSSLRSSSALNSRYGVVRRGGWFTACRQGAERPIHSFRMMGKNTNAAQSTLPDSESQQYAIPSFHGGIIGEGQWGGSQKPRRPRRFQKHTEQDTWNNSQRTVYNMNNISASHQMAYDANSVVTGYPSAPYTNRITTTLNPYMANNEMMPPQNPMNNTANFGWGSLYATPATSYQTSTTPVMQPQWLKMQSAQQMMMPQPMLGGFGSAQSSLTNTNGMHYQQTRHMSTQVSYAKQRRNHLDALRKKMRDYLAEKYRTDEFLKPVEWSPSTEDSDSNSLHPIDQIRRDMWLALPEKYKTDDLYQQFNPGRHYKTEPNTAETISVQSETHRLMLLVREAHIKEWRALPAEEKRQLAHTEPNVLETSEKRQYVRATSEPPKPVLSAPNATSSKDENSTSVIKYIHNKLEPPMTPLPLTSYLEQAAKEPLDLHFMQPLLVILDLNGTLLYRKRKAFPPKFIRRPALDYFLERLTSRHMVMVWSSSRRDTVDAICDEIFSTVQKQKLDPEQFNNKVQVYKVLEKVWADKNIQAKFPTKKSRAGKAAFNSLRYAPGLDEQTEMTGFMNKRWDQSNTVLIDDSTLKAAANPYNIIQVPEFTNVPNKNDQTVLKELLLKIRVLAKSNDVSRRLRSLGPEGIQLRREDILASFSEQSESEAEIIKQHEKQGKEQGEQGEKVVGSTEVFETENQIVPISLPPGAKKERGKADKDKVARRKARKLEKKLLRASFPEPSLENRI
uniref:Putative FCP1 likey domain-containing protein n=1 Tax=Talaromyces marneffei PM1 TaxID=1077442 RepID=A0A093VC84_TALMA